MLNDSESTEILLKVLIQHGFSGHELRFIVNHRETATLAWYRSTYGEHIWSLLGCWGDVDKMLMIQCDVCI